MNIAIAPRTAVVELPAPQGRYRGEFGSRVSIGASSSLRGDEVAVWTDPVQELTPVAARKMAAALLAAADAADAENRRLRGDAAHAELVAWNSTGPCESLATDRALRLRAGDSVADLDNLFASHAPGTVVRVDEVADEVVVAAPWLPDPVTVPLAEAGSRFYLAGDAS